MSFRVIRVSGDYGVVVLVSPEDAGPDDRCENFLYNDSTSESGEIVFKQVKKIVAAGYFGGIADALGFGEKPKDPFNSLEDVVVWIEGKQKPATLNDVIEILEETAHEFAKLHQEAKETLKTPDHDARAKIQIKRGKLILNLPNLLPQKVTGIEEEDWQHIQNWVNRFSGQAQEALQSRKTSKLALLLRHIGQLTMPNDLELLVALLKSGYIPELSCC